MPASNILKIKLVIALFIIPVIKMFLMEMILDRPLFKLFMECNTVMVCLLHSGITIDIKLQLASRLLSLHTLWTAILFLNYVVVFGTGYCSVYRAALLCRRPEKLEPRVELIEVETDVLLLAACVSVAFHALPGLVVHQLFYISLIICGQIGMEFAVFKQFNQLMRVIFRSDEDLLHEFLRDPSMTSHAAYIQQRIRNRQNAERQRQQ